jgi:hypothetical protein
MHACARRVCSAQEHAQSFLPTFRGVTLAPSIICREEPTNQQFVARYTRPDAFQVV